MEYEEIKIGDIFRYEEYVETVISKNDKHKIITTIDSNNRPTAWLEEEFHFLEPVEEQLPEEGLLVGGFGSLVYKLPNGSGYGFVCGHQSNYSFDDSWNFHFNGHWKPATEEQEKKFKELLKKECEKRGLLEDTKLAKCGINSFNSNVNKGVYNVAFTPYRAWNKNGRIFDLGVFATPLKEDLLDKVTKVVNKFGNHIIEKTESGLIIITPIKNHGRNKKKI